MTKPLIIDGEEYVSLKEAKDSLKQIQETDFKIFIQRLDDYIWKFYRKRIHQPIDMIVYLLLLVENGHKEESYDSTKFFFTDGFGHTEEEFINSIKYLETQGLLTSRIVINEEFDEEIVYVKLNSL